MSSWKLYHWTTFATEIKNYEKALADQVKRHDTEDGVEPFLNMVDELADFNSLVESQTKKFEISRFKVAREPDKTRDLIPNIYTLRSRPLMGYYYFYEADKEAIGLHVVDEDKIPSDLVDLLEETVQAIWAKKTANKKPI